MTGIAYVGARCRYSDAFYDYWRRGTSRGHKHSDMDFDLYKNQRRERNFVGEIVGESLDHGAWRVHWTHNSITTIHLVKKQWIEVI